MAKVTGFINDFALGHLAGKHPTVAFQPSGVAVGGAGVFAPDQATVVPVGATGYFEADLQPTDVLRPVIYYTVSVLWGAGNRVFLPWKLQVPAVGGVLADLVRTPANPASAWIGTTPPPDPSPGMWWLNPVTGELSEWST